MQHRSATRLLAALAVALIFWAGSGVGCTPDAEPTNPHARAEPAESMLAPAATPSSIASSPAPQHTPTVAGAVRRELDTALEKVTPMTADDFPTPPDRDLVELARQLRWKGAEPEPSEHQFAGMDLVVGDTAEFGLANLNDRETYRREFRLAAISASAYWWIEDGLEFDDADLQSAVQQAEQVIFPRVTAAFGDERRPGVDGLDRGHIVNARLRGAGGYVSGQDSFPNSVAMNSNEIEAVYMNAGQIKLGSNEYLATLAHELQHSIHGHADASEDTWLNEGLSELATTEAGFQSRSWREYLQRPSASVVNWPAEFGGEVGLNYGASSLFAHYFREHYAQGNSLRLLLTEPADSIAGIDAFLSAQGATTSTGEPATFNTVFADWVAANWLDQAEGPYGYAGLDGRASVTGYRRNGGQVRTTSLQQYGANYIRIQDPKESLTVQFEGSGTTPLLPTDIPGGECWWSNRGDSISSTLTKEVEVPGNDALGNAPALSFRYWHQLEDGWDFVYLEASTNGGATWDVLPAEGTTTENAMGNSYGHGYTGESDWRQINVSLELYAGRDTILRFHYVTDDAIHGPGFCVRDMEVSGGNAVQTGGWLPQGFVRVNNLVRQDWVVWILTDSDGGEAERMVLEHDANADTFNGTWSRPAAATGDLIIAVAPLAPATMELGQYQVWVTE